MVKSLMKKKFRCSMKKYLAVMKSIADLSKQKKAIEDQEKKVKHSLKRHLMNMESSHLK